MSVVRVLLIEDDFWVARVNRDHLEQDGDVRVVGVAASCAEGDRLVRSLEPDLVLLDVYLPDGSGLDLLRAWRAREELVEVVMITAAGDLPSVKRAVAHGVLSYLIKPFGPARLHEVIARYRARHRAARETFSQERLDRYLATLAPAPLDLPKGIDSNTLERVAGLLLDVGGALSAEEVGQRMKLSRVTAWRYLEYLVQAGRAELDFTYGAQGRPAKLYRATR